jgi:hypothetical protein
MSYSFSVRAATRAQVGDRVCEELDKVVAAQPIHSADSGPVLNAASSFLDLLPAPSDRQDYYISISGSVGWTNNNVITAASVSVSASLVAKEKV